MGGDPDKRLPEGWTRPDPRTGTPAGIDRGWAYAPGASATAAIRALAPKLDLLPAQPSIALIEEWLRLPAFAAWMAAPTGAWPLARVPDADAAALGAETRIARLSAETMRKQMRAHAELRPDDYALAQRAILSPTHRVQDGPRSIVYILVEPSEDRGGIVTVVKATQTGSGLFVVSLRRLSRDEADRDAAIAAILRKGEWGRA